MLRLSQLSSYLTERLTTVLPGAAAHNRMRATFSGNVKPRLRDTQAPRPGSVMILLYEGDDGVHFPLIKRPPYEGVHGGQVSLPGGKAEAREDAIQAALRETQEEVGVPPQTIQILGRLSDYHVLPSNILITPIVGMTLTKPAFVPDDYEVERILYGDLDSLLQEDAIRTREITAAGRYPMLAPHFEVEGEVVWGATAMILNELRTILTERNNRE